MGENIIIYIRAVIMIVHQSCCSIIERSIDFFWLWLLLLPELLCSVVLFSVPAPRDV